MIMEIYAIKDKAIDAFLQPFFSPSLASATRSLGHVLADSEHAFTKNTRDYTLFRLGSFDDATGLISTDPEPVLITPLQRLLKA